MNTKNSRTQKTASHTKAGFTLIEILVVIGIIALLATIVIIAINPARQFAQARNTQRESNINTILNAIGQNIADNKGIFTCSGTPFATLPVVTSSINTAVVAGAGQIDLSCLVPTYIPSFPSDPASAVAPATGYFLSVDSVGRTTICAPSAAEPAIVGSGPICVKR